MLHRPSRLVYVRDGDVVTKSKRSKSESALLLTTEFNYQYRVHDPVWLSYKEPGDEDDHIGLNDPILQMI